MSDKDSKTIGNSMEETKERHLRYLRAINNPIRRKILMELKSGSLKLDDLESRINIDKKTITWHMDILEWGYCVEKHLQGNQLYYTLTKEGLVVDYTDK